MRAGRRPAADPMQLALHFDDAPRDAAQLMARLTLLGLRGMAGVVLTDNTTVMVTFGDGVLRVHRSYLHAPEAVHRAIVTFAVARRRSDRRAARRVILSHAHAMPEHAAPGHRRRRAERMHPHDAVLAAKLEGWHRRYNELHFGGALSAITVRVSRRMRSRLGHYAAATPAGEPAEIAIGRRHIRRDGWTEALDTLLHEMVHQWQAENGHLIDHGRLFRKKAREIGIEGSAAREVGEGGCLQGVPSKGPFKGSESLKPFKDSDPLN